MAMLTFDEIHVPFLPTVLVHVRLALHNPDETHDLGHIAYCSCIERLRTPMPHSLPLTGFDSNRNPTLLTSISFNQNGQATSQLPLPISLENGCSKNISGFWQIEIVNNTRPVNVGSYSVIIKMDLNQEIGCEQSFQHGKNSLHRKDTSSSYLRLESDEPAAVSTEDPRSNTGGVLHNQNAPDHERIQDHDLNEGNPTSVSIKKQINEKTNDTSLEPMNTTATNAAGVSHLSEIVNIQNANAAITNIHTVGNTQTNSNDKGDDDDDGEELPAENETVDLKQGLPTNFFPEGSEAMSAADATTLVSSFDGLTRAIRRATEELVAQRKLHEELEVEFRQLQQIIDQNEASLQVGLPSINEPNITQDELVSSYLATSEKFTTLIAEKKSLSSQLASIQNDLITRRHEETKLLTLRNKHAADCQNTQSLQLELERARQYKQLWQQQHKVIIELQHAIVKIGPTCLLPDTFLHGVRYQRLLAKNFGLQRAWIQTNKSRKNGQQNQAVTNEIDPHLIQKTAKHIQSESKSSSENRLSPHQATTISSLEERKRSLHEQLQSMQQEHDKQTQLLRERLQSMNE